MLRLIQDLPNRCFLVCLLVLLLAACNSTPIVETPTQPPAPTPRPSPVPTEAPPVTAQPQVTVTPGGLSVWAVADSAHRDALQKLLREIGEQADIDLVITMKSADALHADIQANLLADAPLPDLIWGTQEDIALLQRGGVIQPANDGIDSGVFVPVMLEGATFEGQRWGTPLAVQNYLVLLYNQEIVGTPPTTTDELISRARELTTDDQYGIVAGWAEPLWFTAWLNGAGGAIVDANNTFTLNTPETINALNLLKELRMSGPPPPNTYEQGVAFFAQGRVAFAIDGDWSIESYQQDNDDLDLGIAPMPLVPGTGRIASSPLTSIYLMYSATLTGEQLVQANVLAQALTQPAAQSRIVRDLAVLPAVSASLSDPAVSANPLTSAAAGQVEQAVVLPATQEVRCGWEAMSLVLPSVLLDERTPEEGAQRMQEAALECMVPEVE